jgi:hypothetical protein
VKLLPIFTIIFACTVQCTLYSVKCKAISFFKSFKNLFFALMITMKNKFFLVGGEFYIRKKCASDQPLKILASFKLFRNFMPELILNIPETAI